MLISSTEVKGILVTIAWPRREGAVAKSLLRSTAEAEQIGICTLEKMHEQEETFDRIAEDMEDIKA